MTITELEAIERISLALVAGGALGLERQWQAKPAGLRTHVLVAEGAALFMIGAILLADQAKADGVTNADPSRVASTIVQGVGFLAGGVILTTGRNIRGLTTAAGLWVAAAIGFLFGAGFYTVGITGTIATVLTLSTLGWVEHRFLPQQDPDNPE